MPDKYTEDLRFLESLYTPQPKWNDYEDETKFNEALKSWEQHNKEIDNKIQEYMQQNREATLMKELTDQNVYTNDSQLPEGMTLKDLETNVKRNHGLGSEVLNFYKNPLTRYAAYMQSEAGGGEAVLGVNQQLTRALNAFRRNPEKLKQENPTLYKDLMNYQRYYDFYNPSDNYTGPVLNEPAQKEEESGGIFDFTTNATQYRQRQNEGGILNHFRNAIYRLNEQTKAGRNPIAVLNPFSDAHSSGALLAKQKLDKGPQLFQDKDGNFTWFNSEWLTDPNTWAARLAYYGDPGKLMGNLLLGGYMGLGTPLQQSTASVASNAPQLTQGSRWFKASQSTPTWNNLFSNDFMRLKFGVEGASNLFGENGMRKTYNHFKNGEYGSAGMSLLGDMWDYSFAKMGLPAAARFGGPAAVASLNKDRAAYNQLLQNVYNSPLGQKYMAGKAANFNLVSNGINRFGKLFGQKGRDIATRINLGRYTNARRNFANQFLQPVTFNGTLEASKLGVMEPVLWYGLPSVIEGGINGYVDDYQKPIKDSLEDYNNTTNPLEKRLKGQELQRTLRNQPSNWFIDFLSNL